MVSGVHGRMRATPEKRVLLEKQLILLSKFLFVFFFVFLEGVEMVK